MTLHWILFLYVFLGMVGLIALLTIVNLYHLFRFGLLSPSFIIMAALAILVPAAILLSGFRALDRVDWGTEITVQAPSLRPNANNLP